MERVVFRRCRLRNYYFRKDQNFTGIVHFTCITFASLDVVTQINSGMLRSVFSFFKYKNIPGLKSQKN